MKRWIVGLVVVVLLAAFALWVTTPDSFSHEDDGRIETWDTQPMPRKTWEQTSGTVEDRAARHKVRRFKTFVRSRQQLRGGGGCDGTKTRAWVRMIGGNRLIPDVVEANMTVTWCYWNDDIRGPVNVNVWGDGRLLWDYQGVIDRVDGHGRNPANVEYDYNRWYFKWTRGLPQTGIGQTTSAWIAMTVRGNGTCTADKYQQTGTEAC